MTKEAILKNLSLGFELEEKAQSTCEEIMSFFAEKQTVDAIRYVRDDEIKHQAIVKEMIRIINKY